MTRYKLATGQAEIGDVESTPTGGTPTATVTAVVANLDTVDLDGDTYRPGAFSDATNLLISSWNHSAVRVPGSPPVGTGRIDEVGSKAIFTGRLWIGTDAGAHLYELLRQRGNATQWSFQFDVLAAAPVTLPNGRRAQQLQRLRINEVSPVWRGAGGPDAHTLSVAADTPEDEAAREYARFVQDGLVAELRTELQDIHERV